ncbi:MAG: PLP-dependent aminotransferase family protein [Lachnospiraceae bacterium]|nr:PLP-dependent aminotransferase family protein [Lachnospiraceae bacterium]
MALSEEKYMQLYRKLREGIIEGAWPYGSRLPSKRTLAAENGISVVTVQHACSLLCDEGYAESRERSGVFVIYRAGDLYALPSAGNRSAAQPSLQRPAAENGAAGTDAEAQEGVPSEDVPHFPASVLARAMRKVLAEQGENLLVKSPNSGLPALKEALAAYLMRSRGIRVSERQIVIGSGAEYLYGVVVQLLGRERLYALEDPSYDKIRRVYEMNGTQTELLAMGSDGILSAALEQSRAGVLHVTPYNSWPSGVTAPASKRAEYIRWAAARGAYVVEDDYDSEFTLLSKPEDTLFSLDPTRCLYLNTFSRTVAPSLRAGYLLLPEQLVPVYEERSGFVSCTVPVFEQYLLAELIGSGDFERHINRVRRQRRKK